MPQRVSGGARSSKDHSEGPRGSSAVSPDLPHGSMQVQELFLQRNVKMSRK